MNIDEELAIELARYVADPMGFVMFAYPWSTDPNLHIVKLVEPWKSRYNCVWGPEAWACELFDYIGSKVRENGFDGRTPVKPIQCAVASGHGISKSATTAMLIDWIMSTRPYCKGVVTAATLPQLETKTWAELAKWTKRCITSRWFDVRTGKNSMSMLKIGSEESWRVDAQTCKEENSESFAGLHAANSTPFYIFDESSGVPDVVYDKAWGGLTDGEPMWFAFGNPTQNTGWFRECFRNQKHRWKTWEIDSRTVQLTNKAYLQQLIDDYGIDHDKVRIKVLGKFPQSSTQQFIGDDLVQAAMLREAKCEVHDPLVLGVDTARYGDDETIIQIRKGRDARSRPVVRLSKASSTEIAAKVQELYNHYRADAIFVDGGGPNGGGTIDELRRRRVPCTEISFGAKPDYSHFQQERAAYANKRAEMYGNLKDWLKIGSIRKDDQFAVELCATEYDHVMRDGRDAILLEPKEDVKKKIGHSPDETDALALTFAYPVQLSQRPTGGEHKVAHNSDYDPFREAFAHQH